MIQDQNDFFPAESKSVTKQAKKRKAYSVPLFTTLGDLRSLTLGASGLTKESLGFRNMNSPERLPPGMPGPGGSDPMGPGGFIPGF